MARPFRIPSRALMLTIAAAASGSVFQNGPAMAAASGPFLSHQALYELSLVKSRGSNAISGARGRILYNFSGSVCEGYTSEFRQVSELDSGEGKLTLSDLRSTSWEDAAGKSYRFKIDARMNDSDSTPVDGTAERTGDHITVKLKQPVAKTFNLDGNIVFPTEQIQHIIAAAREGKPVLELMVYDDRAAIAGFKPAKKSRTAVAAEPENDDTEPATEASEKPATSPEATEVVE